MPAILRILPSQNYASLSLLGLIGSYGQLGHRGQDVGQSAVCNIMSFGRCVYFFGVRYLFRMYCATPNRQKMAVQNKK